MSASMATHRHASKSVMPGFRRCTQSTLQLSFSCLTGNNMTVFQMLVQCFVWAILLGGLAAGSPLLKCTFMVQIASQSIWQVSKGRDSR